MTTQQVADRYYELATQNKWMEIWDELYSPECVNREPEHAAAQGVPTETKGMEAIRAKSAARRAMIEELHAQFCSAPVVGAGFFSCSMGRDVTFKGKPRMKLDEVAVFEVKDGKIVLEQFFY